MRLLGKFLIISIVAAALSCGSTEPASPLKTLQTFQRALKQKDTTTMKMLLSAESMKMLEQEAKSQGVTVDDVVKRETLFSESQKTVEFRNEKIEGTKATLEIKNSFGSWETIPFVLEDEQWKIDKKGYADRLMQDIQKQQDAAFDDLMKQGVPSSPQNP